MDAYEILSTIGCGTFGVVQTVRRRSDDKVLVWKAVQFKNMKLKEKELLVQEVNLLNKLNHPHIIKCYDRIIDRSNGNIYIVQEYAEGGDLAHIIQRCSTSGNYVSEQVLWRIAAQLLSALEYCHTGAYLKAKDAKPAAGDKAARRTSAAFEKSPLNDNAENEPNQPSALPLNFMQSAANTSRDASTINAATGTASPTSPPAAIAAIMHRDLKPGNVFLDGNGDVKLGDFGLARVLSGDRAHAQTWVGTPYYMSPEQLQGKPYNEKCDIWSLGALLYEASALRPPFVAETQAELSVKIQRGQASFPLKRYSREWSAFLQKMLTVDAARRPNASALLKETAIREYFLRQMYKEVKRRERAVEEKEQQLERMFAELHVQQEAHRRELAGTSPRPIPTSGAMLTHSRRSSRVSTSASPTADFILQSSNTTSASAAGSNSYNRRPSPVIMHMPATSNLSAM